MQPGAEVEVSIQAADFLRAAVLAWLLPPAALVALVGLCAALGLSDAIAALLCLPVLALSLLPLALAERRGGASALRITDGPGVEQ